MGLAQSDCLRSQLRTVAFATRCPRTSRYRLVIGKDGKTAVATLVKRMSGFLVLVPLTGRDSLTVGDAVIAATHGLPAQIYFPKV